MISKPHVGRLSIVLVSTYSSLLVEGRAQQSIRVDGKPRSVCNTKLGIHGQALIRDECIVCIR